MSAVIRNLFLSLQTEASLASYGENNPRFYMYHDGDVEEWTDFNEMSLSYENSDGFYEVKKPDRECSARYYAGVFIGDDIITLHYDSFDGFNHPPTLDYKLKAVVLYPMNDSLPVEVPLSDDALTPELEKLSWSEFVLLLLECMPSIRVLTNTGANYQDNPNNTLYYVIDESDKTHGSEGTVVDKDLTESQAERLVCDLCNGGGDPYMVEQTS